MVIVDKIPNFAANKQIFMRIKELLAISMLTVSITAMAQTGKGGTWTLDDCLDLALTHRKCLVGDHGLTTRLRRWLTVLSPTKSVRRTITAVMG